MAVFTSYSQNNIKLQIVFSDSIADKKLAKQFDSENNFKTEKDRDAAVQQLFYKLYDNGYLTAATDSFQKDSVLLKIFVSIGKKYEWAKLKKGNADEEALNAAGFREKIYFHHTFSPKEVAHLLERIITYEENNGYPFASVKLDSISIADNQLNAVLNLQKNNVCLIDSFIVKGNSKISKYYLQRCIGIKPGDKYNEQQVSRISTRLKEVSFLTETKPSQIYFSEKYNKLLLHADEKKANRFDGVLGFLPNETTGKLLITGQLTLKLTNSFNKGEVLDVDWQKLQIKTQNLKAHLLIPFLFRTSIGTDLNFKLYKKDTTFTDVSENIGLNYLLGSNNYFKVFFTNRSIALISTRGLEFAPTLPVNADVNSKLYGLGFKTEKVDYKINPRQGFIININGSTGTKNIKKNLKLNPIAYQGIKLKSTQYNIDITLDFFVPVKRRSTIVLGSKSAFLEGPNLFANELFRIGGLSSLRGFDEESITASRYSIANLEYRFLLDRNSYLFAFANGAYYEKNIPSNFVHDTPYGFGAGITFETKPGIFSLSYALGKQFNNPISVRAAKIHFGIISTF